VTEELKRTPLYDEHRRLNARLVPFAGFEMPVQYAGIKPEHQAVRQRAGLFDVSHMGELFVTGPGAASAVNRLVTNDLDRIEDGRAMYTCCCNDRGTILDDFIVYRYGPERVLVVPNASNRDKIARHFEQELEGDAKFEDASDRYALIALQGPRALDILEAAHTGLEGGPHALGAFRFRDTTVAGKPATVARTGYTGEDGVEIFCASGDAVAIWTALFEAGQGAGVEPAGLGARDTLRLEARLALYGNDIDETTHPLEAGLGWTVKLDKDDFIGKAALQKTSAEGLARKLVGFEMRGRGIARHGYPLMSNDEREVGVCTSGAPSPTLDKNIGLGYLPLELTAVGSEFLVDCRGRKVPAVVVKTPFYKRPRSS
jgi:aminomethyltransferase